MEKNFESILIAYNKGYRVVDGNPQSPNGTIRKLEKSTNNGFRFGIRSSSNKRIKVRVSLLAAYQKYKEKALEPNIYVYHKDGDPANNHLDNIVLGTFSDAQMSKKQEIRINASKTATSFVSKHKHKPIIEMYKNGMTYKQIMEATGIKSKGTISFICKKSEASK
jgi:hypothetical protein